MVERPVQMFLRILSCSESEKNNNESEKYFTHVNEQNLVFGLHLPGQITYKFSHIFSSSSSQQDVFERTTKRLVDGLFKRVNGLLLSHGLTGSDKIFTMLGAKANPGILPRALREIFMRIGHSSIEENLCTPQDYDNFVLSSSAEKDKMLAVKAHLLVISASEVLQMPSAEFFSDDEVSKINGSCDFVDSGGTEAYQVYISMLEQHHDKFFDLLDISNPLNRSVLKTVEDANRNVYIKGALEIQISNAQEGMKLFCAGKRNMRYAGLKMNYDYKQSHCVYVVRLVYKTTSDDSNFDMRSNRLVFCDLAEEELTRNSNSQPSKDDMVSSLTFLALSRCMSAIRYNQIHSNKQRMVPYRASKLTRALQTFFTNQENVSFIMNVNSNNFTVERMLASLRFTDALKKSIKHQTKRTACSKLQLGKRHLLGLQGNKEENSPDLNSKKFTPDTETKNTVEKLSDTFFEKIYADVSLDEARNLDDINAEVNVPNEECSHIINSTIDDGKVAVYLQFNIWRLLWLVFALFCKIFCEAEDFLQGTLKHDKKETTLAENILPSIQPETIQNILNEISAVHNMMKNLASDVKKEELAWKEEFNMLKAKAYESTKLCSIYKQDVQQCKRKIAFLEMMLSVKEAECARLQQQVLKERLSRLNKAHTARQPPGKRKSDAKLNANADVVAREFLEMIKKNKPTGDGSAEVKGKGKRNRNNLLNVDNKMNDVSKLRRSSRIAALNRTKSPVFQTPECSELPEKNNLSSGTPLKTAPPRKLLKQHELRMTYLTTPETDNNSESDEEDAVSKVMSRVMES
ncbi:Kinesin-like protein KIF23 [Trichinella pseudospiralis]|uniref:Kinesin-like protein KIF23 n=1 Tax=Trichinella pseudospiralis TaxID=6337 RepID=A0A0V1KFI2_TRIPS|nr:Kinesin-like protein KIF23 [Trichinella pseudospiralis]